MNRTLCFASISVILMASGCSFFDRAEQPLDPIAGTEAAHLVNFNPKHEQTVQTATAEQLAAAGHAQEAARLYLKAEQTGSTMKTYDRELAPLFAQLGRFDQAIERYRNAIAETPSDNELRTNYVWTLMEAERLDVAETELQSILSGSSGFAPAIDALAVLRFRQGDPQSAFEHFQKNHGAAAARHNVALLFIENGDRENAKRWLDQLPDNALPQTIQLAEALEKF